MNVHRFALLTVLSLCTQKADAAFFDFLCFIPVFSLVFPFCNEDTNVPNDGTTDVPTDAPIDGATVVPTDVNPNGELNVFRDAKETIDSFNTELQLFIEGDVSGGNSRALQDGDDFLDSVSLFTEVLALAGLPLGPKLSLAMSTLTFVLGLGAEDPNEQILAELVEINAKLDDLETKLDAGFAFVVNENKLVNARDNLQQKLELLTDMEVAFKRFTADAREVREEEFRNSCNVEGDEPYQIFRTLYGHGCSDCTALEGGGKDLNFFLEPFAEAAKKPEKGDTKAGDRFRQGFSAIMMSAMSRAMIMHTVCLPTSDIILSEDPVWKQELEEMAVGFEEVSRNLVETEANLEADAKKLNCGLTLKRMCAINRDDANGDFAIKLEQIGAAGRGNKPLTDNDFVFMPFNCVDLDVEVIALGSIQGDFIQFRLEEQDGVFNANDVEFIDHEQPCLAKNLEGVQHEGESATFSFNFEKFDI